MSHYAQSTVFRMRPSHRLRVSEQKSLLEPQMWVAVPGVRLDQENLFVLRL